MTIGEVKLMKLDSQNEDFTIYRSRELFYSLLKSKYLFYNCIILKRIAKDLYIVLNL